MNIIDIIKEGVIKAVHELYGAEITTDKITLNTTRREFEGDYTVVVFPFVKIAKKKPEQVGEELGQLLVQQVKEISSFNVVKGFLNLVVDDSYWMQFLNDIYENESYGQSPANGQMVMVEFCSPNTNKPLHLGHIRNILLGWSSYKILKAAGYEVVRVQIVNDRGIAICKSMLAWEKFSDGETPESSGMKSDHFVGKYYVLFEKKFQEEYKPWQQSEAGQAIFNEKAKEGHDEKAFFKAYKNTYFNEYSQLGAEAKEMLQKWEAGDEEVRALWTKMNNWVYEGFDKTFDRLKVEFDKLYYESNTYLLGKDVVEKGLDSGMFYKKPDGSVWIDLEDAKLDHKLVLRSDGTSVYMTQDIGTAMVRYEDYKVDKMVYVVADEQNYHFQVLFEIMKRLGEPYADGLYHLSYGMVELPTGRMKSREGTVVDADDLMDEVTKEARMNSQERGTLEDLTAEEEEEIVRKIGVGALKFFMIKVQAKKRMIFDPSESVDMQGQTGPYVQNAYVRVRSVLRKAAESGMDQLTDALYESIQPVEKELLGQLFQFPQLIKEAGENYEPSDIANFCYTLAKTYHRFYHDHSILKAESEGAKQFRLKLSMATANALKFGMDLLGIEMPERM
ncbi:MAG: arginine--tRNA ligase [Bacteroidota bacterium]